MDRSFRVGVELEKPNVSALSVSSSFDVTARETWLPTFHLGGKGSVLSDLEAVPN